MQQFIDRDISFNCDVHNNKVKKEIRLYVCGLIMTRWIGYSDRGIIPETCE